MISSRLLSLDAFRGFTIAAMLLVNNPGDWGHLYSQLAHAKWNGWTFTDWIFPFFLFISGVSLTLSLNRQTRAGTTGSAVLRKLSQRVAVVFLIGLALNLYPGFDFNTVRIPGVLQRIALCTLLVPAPDAAGFVGTGVLEPGRDVGAFVDRWLLNGHLWSASRTWGPEGLISTLPALASLLSLKTILYASIQALPLDAVNASLLFAVLFNLFMLGIAWLMWRQRWFVKV